MSTSEGKVKKPLWRALGIVTGVLAGLFAVLMVVVHIVLSPKVATNLVNKYAPEFIDGDLTFGEVKVSMFRHFPNLTLTLKDADLTYPHDRFAAYENGNYMMRQGRAEEADTLAHFCSFSASVNVIPLISGRISIPFVELDHPRVFAKYYNSDKYNWDIFKLGSEEKDTTSTGLPKIKIGKVSLVDDPHIVFSAPSDTLFASLDVQDIVFNGRVSLDELDKSRGKFTIDSLRVAGRLKADTLLFGMDLLSVKGNRSKVDLEARARAFAATKAFGRVAIPLSLDATASFPEDSVLTADISKFLLNVSGVPVEATALAKIYDDKYYLKADGGVKGCNIGKAIDEYGPRFWDGARDVKTDAVLYLDASCDGYYVPSTGEIPSADVSLRIPRSYVKYAPLSDEKVNLELAASASAKPSRKIDAKVTKLDLDGLGLILAATGSANDLLGKDPLLGLDADIDANLRPLTAALLEGIIADGKVKGDIGGTAYLSQLNLDRIGNADLHGSLFSDCIDVDMPDDTITATVSKVDIKLASEANQSNSDLKKGERMLTLTAAIDSVSADVKDYIFVRANTLGLSAHNSADILGGDIKKKVHPFAGTFTAKSISLRDADSMFVGIRNTKDSFTIKGKDSNRTVPVLGVNSSNSAVFFKSGFNRIAARDFSFNANASMNEMTLRMKNARPVVPDSLRMRVGRRMTRSQQAKYEEDHKDDIDLSLSGTLRKYYSQWDVTGGLDIASANIVTPYFPLKNVVSDVKGTFSNDKVELKNLTLNSGESDISATGSVSNLRSALLRKGIVKLDLALSSEVLNANELLAAYDTGSKFQEDLEAIALAENLDDASYEEAIVTTDLSDAPLPENTTIMIPSNVDAKLFLEAYQILYSSLAIDWVEADIEMRDRCLQITNTCATSNMGDIYFEGFYSTKTRDNVKAGFYLNLVDITAEKVIDLMPAVDSILPMLKSFSGMLDCTLAATTSIDDHFNVLLPSLNGVLRISGKNLEINENEDIYKLAKTLMFRNKKKVHVDKMSVEGLVADNKVEVFPFVLDIDRYRLALSGIQNMDTSFKYHVSVIKSPIWFKFGVDLSGDFDDWKWRLGRAKYRNVRKVPVFSSVIDETTLNLMNSIQHIFDKGVELAVQENESQKSISDYKETTGYVSAVDIPLDTTHLFDSKKMQRIEEISDIVDSLGVDIDSLAVGAVDSLTLVKLDSLGVTAKDIDELAALKKDEDDD